MGMKILSFYADIDAGHFVSLPLGMLPFCWKMLEQHQGKQSRPLHTA